jgi:hypothetical protein
MRRFRPLLLLSAVGCASTQTNPPHEEPIPKTAEERQQELQDNLRGGRGWKQQEEMMSDVKNVFGAPSGDALGPSEAK